MKLFSSYKRSFASRISFQIILTTFIVMIGLAAIIQQFVLESTLEKEEERALAILDNTEQRINIMLTAVETAVKNNVFEIEEEIENPDEMYHVSRHSVDINPTIVGAAIAFEPYFYPEKGELFSPYSYRLGDSVFQKQLGTKDYEYHSMDWYLIPKLLDRDYWSEPYYDEGGGEQLMTTFSLPLKDKDGRFYGIATADISLHWLSTMMDSIKTYERSYTFVIGRGGAFITHPDKEVLVGETCFSLAEEINDTTVRNNAYRQLAGETGMTKFHENTFGESYIFYKPISRTGWSMAIICDADELFRSARHNAIYVFLLMLTGLVILSVVCYSTIRRISRPLEHFTHSVDEIARGNLNARLPDIKSRDEMMRLHDSFQTMQTSIKQQMEELKTINEQKGRIEGELQIARDIQMSMLPKQFPAYPERDDIDIYGMLTPAKAVGGDLYDFYIRDEKLFFCIGDVSGKGIPAALLMATTRALFRSISRHVASTDQIVAHLNDAMTSNNDYSMFVTLFVGILDLPTGRLRYCNAGHDAPLLIGSGIGLLPTESNIPIGVMPGWKYVSQEALIDPYTTIFLYTDGLTEAEDCQQALFGEERVIDTARKALADGQQQPQALIERMMAATQAFVAGAQQSDDLTMLAIQYTKEHLDVRFQRSITLPNDVQAVPQLTAFVESVCEAVGFDMSTAMQLQLAIEEAVVNVMNYAYAPGKHGDINIEAQANDVRLKFIIIDRGTSFDPTDKEEVDTSLSAEERPIGGLGIHLIRTIMDSINYERVNGQNILTLRKNFDQPAVNSPIVD